MKIRIDELLVIKKFATTRSKAKELVLNGLVSIGGNLIKKPGQSFSEDSDIKVGEHIQYVGRGAHKIREAIEHFKIDINNKTVADVGASTGGFTDYVLQNGAKKVYAIDVGHGQLDQKLINDQRVINMEGTNIKDDIELEEKVDLAVVDLSYISLRIVLKHIKKLIKKGGDIITLIKPQFEAGPKIVGKDGVIKDQEKVKAILDEFIVWAVAEKFQIIKTIPSPIHGKKGNTEFLAHFKV